MSDCISGKEGALAVGGTNIAMLQSWTVTQNAEVLECSFMGTTWKEHKTGLLSWEGSCEAYFAHDDITPGQAANAVTVGTQVALTFYPEASDTNVSFTGNAVVTSVENSASVGDIQSVSLSFTGTGALTTDITP